jgi:hypothetical protein
MTLLDLARAALEQYDRDISEGDQALVAQAVRPHATETSGHWLIIQAERAERCFTPAVTRAELQERYPGAVLIALPDTTDPLPLHLQHGQGPR